MRNPSKKALLYILILLTVSAMYLYSLKTNKKERLKIDEYGAIEHAFFSPDKKGFFFTARESNKNMEGTPNSLYYYHIGLGDYSYEGITWKLGLAADNAMKDWNDQTEVNFSKETSSDTQWTKYKTTIHGGNYGNIDLFGWAEMYQIDSDGNFVSVQMLKELNVI